MRDLFVAALFALLLVSPAFAAGVAELKVLPVKYDPYPAEAGAYFDIWVKAENIGTQTVNNASIMIEQQFPFSLDPGADALKELGNLQPGQQAMAQFKVRVDPDAVDGDNALRYSYKLEDTPWVTRDYIITVDAKKADLRVGSLDSSPLRLVSDSMDNKLSIGIDNIGGAEAKSVLVKLSLPSGLSPSNSYSNIANIGSIAKDSSKAVVFYVDVNKSAPAGDYAAMLELGYKSGTSGNILKEALPVTIPVKPSAVFEIMSVSTNPAAIGQGAADVELRVRLRNAGSREAKSVSLKAFKAADQPFDFSEKSDYIGTLKEGAEGDAILKFSVTKDAALKEYLVNIEVRSVEDSDVRLSEYTVPVRVELAGKETNYNVFAAAGLAAAALYLAYARRRNGAKKGK